MAETLPFQAEVRQLLDLVVHSLYSDREIFLRELISNASDALDRARFLSLQRDDLLPASGDPRITVSFDKALGTLTIEDNGVGLTREQAIEHLGTIAKSGTKAFLEGLKAAGQSAEGLIGQFGVGFYSSFMVANKVVVRSLSAEPGAEPIVWTSEGAGEFSVEPGTRATRGTEIVLHLRADTQDFADAYKIKDIVEKYSDFVQYPVWLEDKQINQPQALWTRNPKEVSEDEYVAFYKHISTDWQAPLAWTHFRSEAPLEFSAAIFIPGNRPFDLDYPDAKRGLRLFQRRVMIKDNAEEFLPRYLRFVKGVVDAPEVSLNVSREILQQTPVLQKIRNQIIKRTLRRLKELASEDEPTYLRFYESFGATLKEGVAEDHDNKEALLPLLRFRTTTHPEGWRSLEALKADLKEGQDTLYYLTGLDRQQLLSSPQLELARKKGWEVLLLSDPVDEWVVMNLPSYEGTTIKSLARGEITDDAPEAEEAKKAATPFTDWLGVILKGQVAGVRPSTRLTDSPAVLVDDEGGVSANMERILRASRQSDGARARRFLEINPTHPLVKRLIDLQLEGKSDEVEPLARLLLDYARVAEGYVEDVTGLARRLQALMLQAAGKA